MKHYESYIIIHMHINITTKQRNPQNKLIGGISSLRPWEFWTFTVIVFRRGILGIPPCAGTYISKISDLNILIFHHQGNIKHQKVIYSVAPVMPSC